MKKIIIFLGKRNKLLKTLGVFDGIILICLMFPEIAKYCKWQFDFLQFLSDKGQVAQKICILIFVLLSTIILLIVVSKLILKRTSKTLIIQEGLDGKRIAKLKTDAFYEKNSYYISLKSDEKDSICYALKEMTNNFETNYLKLEKYDFLYYGVSYTPFVYKLGALYSDQGSNYYYAQIMRTKKKTKVKLFAKKQPKNIPIINAEYLEKDEKSDLLVTIGLSYDIDETMDLKFQEMSRLKITTANPSVNLILSNEGINAASKEIASAIRKYNTKYSNIHLFISASTALTFALGVEYSKAYDKNIFVYHYDSTKLHNRPWCISILEKNEKKAIKFIK